MGLPQDEGVRLGRRRALGLLGAVTAVGALGLREELTMAAEAAGAGNVARKDPGLDAIYIPETPIEKLAGGFAFTEGPIQLSGGRVLFSDIPNNVVLQWDALTGKVSDYRRPSGQTNGNTLDAQGRLISCEHGGRRVARQERSGEFVTVVDRFEGKRLNSPNDVIVSRSGAIYFTDPPYGLPKQDQDPGKELGHNGLYRFAGGKLTLLTAELTRPNGLAFSPDEKTLYVANSDPARKLWMAYPVKSDGTIGPGRVFFDVSRETVDGLPDGMKVDSLGNIYATGPGGVWVFTSGGKHLGTISPTEVPANCHWGDDGKSLYMTARTGLYRVRLKVPGIRPIPK